MWRVEVKKTTKRREHAQAGCECLPLPPFPPFLPLSRIPSEMIEAPRCHPEEEERERGMTLTGAPPSAQPRLPHQPTSDTQRQRQRQPLQQVRTGRRTRSLPLLTQISHPPDGLTAFPQSPSSLDNTTQQDCLRRRRRPHDASAQLGHPPRGPVSGRWVGWMGPRQERLHGTISWLTLPSPPF